MRTKTKSMFTSWITNQISFWVFDLGLESWFGGTDIVAFITQAFYNTQKAGLKAADIVRNNERSRIKKSGFTVDNKVDLQ